MNAIERPSDSRARMSWEDRSPKRKSRTQIGARNVEHGVFANTFIRSPSRQRYGTAKDFIANDISSQRRWKCI
jgi:hypothetical protein